MLDILPKEMILSDLAWLDPLPSVRCIRKVLVSLVLKLINFIEATNQITQIQHSRHMTLSHTYHTISPPQFKLSPPNFSLKDLIVPKLSQISEA